jgi:hypothetical protein
MYFVLSYVHSPYSLDPHLLGLSSTPGDMRLAGGWGSCLAVQGRLRGPALSWAMHARRHKKELSSGGAFVVWYSPRTQRLQPIACRGDSAIGRGSRLSGVHGLLDARPFFGRFSRAGGMYNDGSP